MEDALLILRKWREERRAIQAALIISDRVSSCAVGRIEHIGDDDFLIRVDGSSMFRTGRLIGLTFELARATGIRFEDWRDAPTELAQGLREAYEGFIFADFGNYHCELYAAKTADELPPA